MIAPTTPSSSPPTTPISTSSTIFAFLHSASSSRAISRFSVSDTAEPSHMCDWNSGVCPRATRSWLSLISGRTYLSRLFFGQWSVCRAMLTGYFAATTWAYSASADAPITMSLTLAPDR